MTPFNLFLILLFSVATSTIAQSKKVLISTNYGNMTVMLYDATPNHRDNFIKLVNEKHFDGTLFYRVIKNFVIQGGSSDSRNAPKGKKIGYGSSALTINSEFADNCVHKKGALCAPRQPEMVNEFKKSDISQFYIVQGRVYTTDELNKLMKNMNTPILNDLKRKYYIPKKTELDSLKLANTLQYNQLLKEIKNEIEFYFQMSRDKLDLNNRQLELYTTVGGIPDLDGDYTVFGEVIEGLEVIDKIANIPTDASDRPVSDVKITITCIN